MTVWIFFDFKLKALFRRVWHRPTADQTQYERRSHRFCSIAGLLAQIRIRQMCSELSRQFPCSQTARLRTVRRPGLRPVDLAREFARYRDVPARFGLQTLSQ